MHVPKKPKPNPAADGVVPLRRAESTAEGFASIVKELELLFTSAPTTGWVSLETITGSVNARLHVLTGGGAARAAVALRSWGRAGQAPSSSQATLRTRSRRNSLVKDLVKSAIRKT